MSDTQNTNWTPDEFRSYLLLFAAQADFNESEIEKEEILKLVSLSDYKHVHKEIDQDNDYQRIQKILNFVQHENYSEEYLNILLDEVHEVLVASGYLSVNDANFLRNLKAIFKK